MGFLVKQKMSRWGVGPVFAAVSMGYGLIVLSLGRYFDPIFKINVLPHWLRSILGVVLIVVGGGVFYRFGENRHAGIQR